MAVLSNLEPKKVFQFFEEICSVPHGSGNIWHVSNYCVAFAKQRGLEYIQDELGNVIIFAPAAPGYEDAEPVILQGHMDMVCVKTPDCPLDLTKDGLELAVDGDSVYAKGTSLGADNGIAVAMALALLDSPEIPRPAVEALITVDEETGLFGAAGVDMTPMKGKKLINMDSEDEGVFTVSCAGGARAVCTMPVSREETTMRRCQVTVGGLLGGHSGIEINKGRGSANKLLGRVLARIAELTGLRLVSMEGGFAGNVITKESKAVLCAADLGAVKTAAQEMESVFKSELAETDGGVVVSVDELGAEGVMALTADSTAKCIQVMQAVPQGVQAMSKNIEGLVQTSLNFGVLKLEEELEIQFSVRSSVPEEKKQVLATLTGIFGNVGGSVNVSGDYPAWEYKEESPLRDLCIQVFVDQYGRQPKVDAIHAGLECGLLSGKRPELDCISIGPDLRAVHSVDEKLSISSTQRVWAFLLEVLKRSK